MTLKPQHDVFSTNAGVFCLDIACDDFLLLCGNYLGVLTTAGWWKIC